MPDCHLTRSHMRRHWDLYTVIIGKLTVRDAKITFKGIVVLLWEVWTTNIEDEL